MGLEADALNERQMTARAIMVFILIAGEHLPFQKSLCRIPVFIGATLRASFLSVNLMRQARDFIERRAAIEAGVGIHQNESSFCVHLRPESALVRDVVVKSRETTRG
jgi:hypothetical protein